MNDRSSDKPLLPRISGWTVALILAPVLLGTVAALVAFRDALIVTQPPPERFPALPAPAAALVGVAADYFFQADPYVQARDEQIYRLVHTASESWWEVTPLPAGLNPGVVCPENRQRPLAVAGTIVECRTVRTIGEWCPGPIVSFAITANGEVWRHNHERLCTFPLIYLSLFILPVLLAVGVFLAALRRIILRSRENRRADHVN